MTSQQKVVLITGASSGIGQATAELLAANGFRVFGTSRNPISHKHSFTWLPLDVRSDDSVYAAVQSLLGQTGRLDILINNAGYMQVGAVEESSIADVQAQFDTNLFGIIRMIKAVMPIMRQQGSGHIINVSSIVGHIAPPYGGLYSASKFALEGLSESLSAEVRQFGVSVSLVEPSYVNTPFVAQPPTTLIGDYSPGRQRAQQSFATNTKKGLEPGAVARAILQAATSQPRLRYPVGRDGKIVLMLQRVLPEAAFEALKRRLFSSEKTAA
ncbi:SDR family NAD(P)-dependent oxidoreductase [Herpetosiphon gulosus]|uniref:Oxidoreductase SA2266 n=1 Tax=Herpetosiphon gulosus TaxID=1973496 RepID=A0ABP9WWG6_9CHLR